MTPGIAPHVSGHADAEGFLCKLQSFLHHDGGPAVLGLACCLGLTLSVPAVRAQDSPLEEEAPLIENVAFRGVEALRESELRTSIETQETRCRSMLFKPFCWAADWSIFVDKRYLNREELQRDVVRLRVFYYRRGYRESTVSAEVTPAGEGVDVVFLIEEGEPTRIDQVEVRQDGDALSDRTLRRARLPGEEDVLNLEELELGIRYLEQQLGEKGYLDAEVRDSIDIDRSARLADVSVTIEPGRRSTLEALEIRGNEAVADGTIAQALRLRPGRVLSVNDILAARRSLYESNLFHEVDVGVPEQPDSAKRVEVDVREAPPRVMRVGGGFNTIEFVQFEGRYTHYNWLGAGRRLEIRGVVGNLLASQLNGRIVFEDVLPREAFQEEAPFLRPTWQLSVGFRQPSFPSAPLVLGLDVFASRRTIPGIVVDRGYGAGASITRRAGYDTQISLRYTYELTSVRAGDLYFCVNYAVCDLTTIDALRGSHALSPVEFSWRSDKVDDPLAAGSGHRLWLDVEHASAFTASEFRYNRVVAEGRYYWPQDLHRRRVIAGRLRAGWVGHLSGTAEAVGLDPDRGDALLHPRKRFYAGGSRSVRGFGENQLGPQTLTVNPTHLREADGGCTNEDIAARTCDPHVAPMDEFMPQPIGGTALLEGSVEYRFPFFGFVGAVFVDGAILGEGISATFSKGNSAVTPGMGARFTTPVGPVRIDLGFRPNSTRQLPVVTEYVDVNGQAQLVELERRRRFNAVQAAGGGFLREIFSRFALHLSIGEAY